MDQPATNSLSPQQRECLRLVAQQLSSKEIALRLGISKNTVDGYVAEAVAKLGARDRRHAARIWIGSTPPDPVRGNATGVAEPPIQAATDAGPEGVARRSWLPVRPRGSVRNDLPALVRIAWIPAIAFALAVGFGMLAVGLRTAGEVYSAILHGH